MKKTDGLLKGEVLDLKDEIALLSPTDTPLTTLLMGKGKVVPATDITVTWREKELNDTRGNPRLEGAEAGDVLTSTRELKSNICQILEKVTAVSGTLGALDVKGVGDEFNAEIQDRLIELKRDMEYYFIQGTKSTTEGVDGREMDGLLNMVGNVIDAGDNTEVGELNEDNIIDLLQMIWETGAQGEMYAFVNAGEKRIINNLLVTNPNSRVIVEAGANEMGIIVDKVITDFGDLNLVLNRHMPTGQLLAVDLDLVEIAELRTAFYEDLAKTGDFQKGHIVAENTIKLLNSKAGGKIIGITK